MKIVLFQSHFSIRSENEKKIFMNWSTNEDDENGNRERE